MIPSKEDIRSTLNAVPKRTWKIVGGLLAFGILMRLVTSLSANRN